MKTPRLFLTACLALAPLAALAQSQNVQQQKSTKRVYDDIVVPSGKSFTVESGGSFLVNPGATVSISGVAPESATFITQVPSSSLSQEQALSLLGTGIIKNTTTTGILSIAAAGTDYLAPIAIGTTVQAWDADLDSWALKVAPSGVVVGTTDTQTLSSKTLSAPVISGAISFPDGVTQVFNPNGTNAGINVGAQAGDPSSPVNGDLWYDSTANELTARIAGANVALGSGGGGGGDVTGAASSTDNALVRFDGTGGKTIQNSNVTLADSGTALVFSGAAGIQAGGANQNVTLTPSGTGITETFLPLRVAASVASTSTTTGSVRVTGGIGASGNIWGGGSINASDAITRTTGSGGVRGSAPITIYQAITAVGNVGTGEDALISQSIAGLVLPTNGDRLRIRATFTFAANANNKTLKAKYGATTYYDSTALAINGGSAVIETVITRTGAATQNVSMTLMSSNATLPSTAVVTTAAETLSGAVVVTFTGEATANDDISQRELLIEYLPAP